MGKHAANASSILASSSSAGQPFHPFGPSLISPSWRTIQADLSGAVWPKKCGKMQPVGRVSTLGAATFLQLNAKLVNYWHLAAVRSKTAATPQIQPSVRIERAV